MQEAVKKMNFQIRKGQLMVTNMGYFRLTAILLLFCLCFVFGCAGERKADDEGVDKPVPLNNTVGALAEFYDFGAIPVRGFGLVGNLNGTGSSECPPELRAVLIKYITQQGIGVDGVPPNSIINSMDTAIVEVYGVIPGIALKGEEFDVKVAAFANTQTTSLDGGRLFTCELKPLGRVQRFNQYAKTMAYASGPIYIDKVGGISGTNSVTGYILNGGVALNEAKVRMTLNKPNYFTASTIRNRINERFGRDIAKATSPAEIEISIPDNMRARRAKFLSMIIFLYIADDAKSQSQMIDSLIENLAGSKNKVLSELSLDAIGKPAIRKLLGLLTSRDEAVRFHASRCLLDIGSDKGLDVLLDLALDRSSPLRLDAINAVGTSARRNDATGLLTQMLASDDFETKYLAYDHLRKRGDISISHMFVGKSFMVDNVICPGRKVIYVTRSGIPKIVLFGSPIYCNSDIFVESDNGKIIINAPAGGKYVSVMRKHPTEPRLIGPVISTFAVTDLIKVLSDTPAKRDEIQKRSGLSVPYADTIALLKKLCENGSIDAVFEMGAMTTAGAILEKPTSKVR